MPGTNPKKAKDDVNLVELSLKKPDNFALIIQKYQKPLFYYIKRISNLENEDIEDELQEIFLKVYQNLNNYNSNLKFSSWIYRIARNHIISHYRKLKSRPQRISNDWEINENILVNIANDLNLTEEMEQTLLAEKISSNLNKLNLKYREVLIYKFFEEKSYEEISDIIKKPIGTVGTLINRAKKQFLKIYQE